MFSNSLTDNLIVLSIISLRDNTFGKNKKDIGSIYWDTTTICATLFPGLVSPPDPA